MSNGSSSGNGSNIVVVNVGTSDTATGNLPKFTDQPNFPSIDNQYWRTINAIWPDLIGQQAFISPARNGMNRYTGQMLQGWEHVQQSMQIIFQTPYHERVLRRWVGSFVPMLLGESIVPRIITRFFWAIATALDLWEPDYRFNRVYFMGNALTAYSPPGGGTAVATAIPGAGSLTGIAGMLSSADLIRLGQAIFRFDGTWIPRGHLGDFTPFERKSSTLVGSGNNIWDVQATTATSK